jgi:proteasome lid subunit RPN8/RPN11
MAIPGHVAAFAA